MVLRGAALFAGTGVLALFLLSWLLEVVRYDAGLIAPMRLLLWAALVFALVRWVARPLFRRVSDEQVALYLEENEPTLANRFLVAVESGGGADTDDPLLSRVIRRALKECRKVRDGDGVHARAIGRGAAWTAAMAALALLLPFAAPSFVRHGASALFDPTREAASASPYSIVLAPGDTTISRGADLAIVAAPSGFGPGEVELRIRQRGESEYRSETMISSGGGAFEFLLLSVREPIEYYADADGVASTVHAVEVADLPAVRQLSMTYRFPEYAGLAPRRMERGGDVAALEGTRVELDAVLTLPATQGRIVLDHGDTIPMARREDGAMTGAFVVERPGFYAIQLLAENGSWVMGAPEFRIDPLADQPPSMSFRRPGRDIDASPIEEVYVEAMADDDVGVAEMLLILRINGGPEDTLRLHGSRGAPMPEVTSGMPLYLEEYGLKVGDLLAYYGVARDNSPRGAETLTDIYFIEARPFEREYRRAEGGGMAGGGGGGEGPSEDLSGTQRQIIAATFNLARDRERYAPESWDENVVSVALSQERLREQVETLRQRILNRGIAAADESFRVIAEELPKAAAAMTESAELLRELDPTRAAGAQQRALRSLQAAEATFERYVSMEQQQGGGGGGGGGAGPDAEDLADLFELEVDKLRNQYETLQRSRRESQDQGVDETLEKLRELARRQEQELERQRRREAAGRSPSGESGSEEARGLAEETEEAARQLERLAAETGEGRLRELARELRDASREMRRAAAGGEGAAAARSALERLRDARGDLEEMRDGRLRRDVQDARERAGRLQEQQAEVESRLERLQAQARPSREEVGRIREAKTRMADEAQEILEQLEAAAADARRSGREGFEEIQDAVEVIRDTQLRERLLASRGWVGRQDEDFARAFESQTRQAIQSLRHRLEDAARSVEAGEAGSSEEEALDATRDLVRSLESMGERLRAEQPDGGAFPGENADEEGAGLSADDARRLRREFAQRGEEANRLLEAMGRNAAQAGDLSRIIGSMRRLEGAGAYNDPEELLRIQEAVLEGLKQLEFELRKEALGAAEEIVLEGTGEAPPGYRELVEEYYRQLSKAPPPGSGI